MSPAPRCVVDGCAEFATRGTYGPALCEAHGIARGVPPAPDPLEQGRRERLVGPERARETAADETRVGRW